MYPDFGYVYKRAHVQSVCTRPFLPHREGPGDEAMFNIHWIIITKPTVGMV